MADHHPVGAWALHRDPAGFTVHKPAAWRVQAGTPGELVVSDPHGSASAMVRARIVPAPADLAQWMAWHYAITEPGLYNVRMQRVECRGPQVAHLDFDYGSTVFQGRASVTAVRHGEIATLFVAAAARQGFDARLPELARILGSVRYDHGSVRLPHPSRVQPVAAVACGRYFLPAVGRARRSDLSTLAEGERGDDIDLVRLLLERPPQDASALSRQPL